MSSGFEFNNNSKLANLFNNSLDRLATATERFSSGLRINKAPDDAAALALSNKNDRDAALYRKSIESINSASSLVSVAEEAIDAQEGVLNELVSLAELATNSSLSTTQRTALDDQAQALVTEYERISTTASYNGRALFSHPNSSTVFQAGPEASNRISFTIGDSADDVSFTPGFNLLSVDAATAATTNFTENLEYLSIEKGKLEGTQERLNFAAAFSEEVASIFEYSADQIRSEDTATLVADYLAAQIKADNSGAMFAQANQLGQNVAELISETFSKESE